MNKDTHTGTDADDKPRSGYIVTLELFVPCHPSSPESMSAAAAHLRELQDNDFGHGVEVTGFKFRHVARRK